MILSKLRRFDYPRCAPHATQAWPQHRAMLDAIFALGPAERRGLVDALWDTVLALKEFKGRSGTAQSPRPFSLLLNEFPHTRAGEPPGALLQALAFAYYRADAPNVTLETAKVGAGSKRAGRVGDIDGWSGDNLVLSIEVKDIDIDEGSAEEEFVAFEANLDEWPDATAIVVARSFTAEAVQALGKKSVCTLDRKTMARNVAIWDLRKQQLAMREIAYFLERIQRNSKLYDRLLAFAKEHKLPL